MSVLTRLLNRPGGEHLVVEPMRRRNLAAVMAIESVSYPKPWTFGVFRSELEQMAAGNRHYLVAHEGRELVAYGGMLFALDEAHITNVAVDARHQRKGLATRLMAELAWVAIDRHCTALSLEVRVGNTPAITLYEKFGFTAAGVRKQYYENADDAIVMWRHGILEPEFASLLRVLSPEAAR